MASSSSERGMPFLQRNPMGTETEPFPLDASINSQGTPPQYVQPTSAPLNVSPEYKKLSDWGKNAYRDISEKMINAGIRSDKFDDGGMLKKTTSLGQWLIKELDMKEVHLGPAAAQNCMVFVQPGGNDSNTWKLVWLVLVNEVSWNTFQGPQYVQHSMSNFPGPQLVVGAQESKHRQLVLTQLW